MDGTTVGCGVDVGVGAVSLGGVAHAASIRTTAKTMIDAGMMNSSSWFLRLCLVISTARLALLVSCGSLSLPIVYQKEPHYALALKGVVRISGRVLGLI